MISVKKCRTTATLMIFALGIGLCAGAGSGQAVAAKKNVYKIDGKWVGFDKKTGRLTKSAGLSYIPKKIAGKKVKILGKRCYEKNTNIKIADIPSSVTRIEEGAFYGCPKLGKVVFPKGIKVGDVTKNKLFCGCDCLKTVVNNPDKKWQERMKNLKDTLAYLEDQEPSFYVENVRSLPNMSVPDENGNPKKYTDEQWEVVAAKAQELTKECETDTEKAKAICRYVTGYPLDPDADGGAKERYEDAYHLLTWDASEHGGEVAMTTGTGYANLTQALFCAAQIPCIHVLQKKNGSESERAFNVAFVDGGWRWIDGTCATDGTCYDAQIAGFAACGHRCDCLSLTELSALRAGEHETPLAGTYLKISQETAKEMMDRDDGHVIVDVRREDEYDESHIVGAILIPNETIGTEKPEKLPDTDQIILVYCRSGNRSKQASQKLADMGYTKVYEFGGIKTWPYGIVG